MKIILDKQVARWYSTYMMKNIMTHDEMAEKMFASLGLTTEGININTKGIVAEVDEFALENDYSFNGRNYVADEYALIQVYPLKSDAGHSLYK